MSTAGGAKQEVMFDDRVISKNVGGNLFTIPHVYLIFMYAFTFGGDY